MRIRWRGLELPSNVRVEDETLTNRYGKFIVEPFERGFGTTIGNSFRRILLSSLEGTAVTSVRIKGVDHEFMGLHGVYEDIPLVVMVFKRLQVRITGDGPKVLTLNVRRKGEVTAADFAPDAEVEIINPELVICTLTEEREFSVEVTVQRGRGYVAAQEHTPEPSIGEIPVDAIYSPVTRVRYKTENTRVGKLTNYDRLILEIWTNGTVLPESSLVEAAKIFRKHLSPFVQYFELKDQFLAGPVEVGQKARENEQVEALRRKLNMPVSDLDLNVRAMNVMKAERIHTIGDLVARKEDDLLNFRNLGKTTLKEIKQKLGDMGLDFGFDTAAALGAAAAGEPVGAAK
jgi:DNA-directed RNA polymerase subunit alpha